jgi:uncharacterized protein (DUF1800 family)
MNRAELVHLYSRAGFGAVYSTIKQGESKSREEVVSSLFHGKALELTTSIPVFDYSKYPKLSKEQKKKLHKELEEYQRKINLDWLKNMVNSDFPLHEKMTLFWANHFVVIPEHPELGRRFNNVLRKHALGSFKEMLHEVSFHPAMLQFLNNQQNKKKHPNENFARELLELFTLGRGNYTEKDIREAARAFTGYGFNLKGEPEFRENWHDEEEKTVLGKTGNLDAKDILDLVLEKKETAVFVCRKLFRFLVNEKVDESIVAAMADHFFASGYRIDALLKWMFLSDWFYDAKHRGALIKSPVELMVGVHRLVPVRFEDEKTMLLFQNIMGQVLFHPPNVAGWSGGKSWIDSQTLLFRLKYPSAVLNDGLIDWYEPEYKEEVALMMEKMRKKIHKKIGATANWNDLLKEIPGEIRFRDLAEILLTVPLSDKAKDTLEEISKADLKTKIIELLSLPEYQLA